MDNSKQHLQLVYLGSSLPSYFVPSLQIINRYNDLRIEFLGEQGLSKELPKGLVNFVSVSDFYDRTAFASARANLQAPIGFRDGFWHRTLERFFVLSQFASYAGRSQVFHAEGDQLLVGGERLLSSLETTGRRGLFFPMHTDESAVASVFFANELSALHGLLTFAEQSTPFRNEMQLLAAWGAAHQDEFHRLPTLADLLNGPDNGATPIDLRESGQHTQMPMVVDAAQIGQWVAGIDPRNIGSKQEARNHFCDPPIGNLLTREQLNSIGVRFDEKSRTLRVFQDSKQIAELSNLHLHSKIHAWLAGSSERIRKLLAIAERPTSSVIFALSSELKRFRRAEKASKFLQKLDKKRESSERIYNRFFVAIARSLGYRPPSFPFISGDSFRHIADFVWEGRVSADLRRRVANSRVLFCEGNRLEEFVEEVLPHVLAGSTLILGNSDRNFVPRDFADLDRSNVHRLFVQNLQGPHDRAIPLPIGLENAWRRNYGSISAFTRIRREDSQRNGRVMWSFNVATNPLARQLAEQSLRRFRLADNLRRVSPPKHRKALKNYSFVACPPGNGLDTHRVWEAMYLGCIPIVPSNYMNDYFAKLGLPLFVVDSFSDLTDFTPKDLARIEEELRTKFDCDALWARFWLKAIAADGAQVPKSLDSL